MWGDGILINFTETRPIHEPNKCVIYWKSVCSFSLKFKLNRYTYRDEFVTYAATDLEVLNCIWWYYMVHLLEIYLSELFYGFAA